jgi:hypothetical protein
MRRVAAIAALTLFSVTRYFHARRSTGGRSSRWARGCQAADRRAGPGGQR